MANHSPEPDNYVGKKTWEEAMDGKKAVKPATNEKPEPDKNPARGNGGNASK